MQRQIFVGFDPREAEAFAVFCDSIRRHLLQPIPIRGLVLEHLREQGIYTRPMEIRRGVNGARVMWDVPSDAPMATEFANSRFFVQHLARHGLALFADCDMLARTNVARLFDIAEADRTKALWCVKHKYEPKAAVKMDGQVQTKYARKNWSSLMVWNCDHPAHYALSLDDINRLPGRDLHRFCWLHDDDIGELELAWNYLIGNGLELEAPHIVHFTNGGPWMAGYEKVAYADEWRAARNRWASSAAA